MEKVYTEEELMAGYAEMYDLNSQISEESFGIEIEAESINYKKLEELNMTVTYKDVEETLIRMGFDTSKQIECTLGFLIKTKADLQEFVRLINIRLSKLDDTPQYWKIRKNRAMLGIMQEFRKNKIDANDITEEQFVKEYEDDPIKALESLFQESIGEWWLDSIAEKGLTASQIYKYHKCEPYDYFTSALRLKSGTIESIISGEFYRGFNEPKRNMN